MDANPTSKPEAMHAAVALALETGARDAQAGRLTQAEDAYRVVLHQQPQHAEAHYKLASLLSQRDGLDGALPHYVAALRSDERQPKYWLALATALLAQDRLAEAKSLLEGFVALGFTGASTKDMTTRLVDMLFAKARAHHRAGRIGDAEILYDTSLMLDSSHAPSLHGAALATYARGQRNDAAALLRLAVAADGSMVAYHADLAKVLYEGGAVAEALGHAERALELDPNAHGVRATQLAALYGLGQSDRAIAGYRAATAEKPDCFRGNRELEALVRYVKKLDAPAPQAVPSGSRGARRAKTSRNDVFYVASPGYSYLSGGPSVLHLLCHHLNELGHDAYMYTDRVSGTLRTPMLTAGMMDAHRESGRRRIGIYPEIELSNRLNCECVIRYLLNAPGARSTRTDEALNAFWTAPERRREYMMHFAEEFQVPYLKSSPLFLPTEDGSLFHKSSEPTRREGFLVYSHRTRVTPDMIPDWAKPYTMIEMSNYKTPEELAELYRTSEALIVFERTGAAVEAMLCGCPVVGIPNDNFKHVPMFTRVGNLGVGWGAEYAQLEWARKSVDAYCNVHRAYTVAAQTEVELRVDEALDFFDAGDAWSI